MLLPNTPRGAVALSLVQQGAQRGILHDTGLLLIVATPSLVQANACNTQLSPLNR